MTARRDLDGNILTAAQIRALEWLPADGGWAAHVGRREPGLWSLITARRDEPLAERAWCPKDDAYRYRLTDAGVALRADRKAELATTTRNVNSQGDGA